ncbi:MAG: phosphoenolpyruvate synthase [Nanoarchaeota archaeon]|nr:phosphoenolpyruvate synthase [Nanoarchaeota archaeon]
MEGVRKEGNGSLSSDKSGFVKWFSELSKDSLSVAGGKGANLAEIYNLGVSVPPGFVVTVHAYNYFIEKAGIDDKIKSLLENLDYEDTSVLDKVTGEIRNLIEKSNIPKEMEEEILESYESLGGDDLPEGQGAHDLLRRSPELPFVAVRSSAITEDLAGASFAGQQDSFLNVKGNFDLLVHIKKCFASLFTPRATYYRNKKGFKYEGAKLAVVIQKMVDSDKSGVVFSKDPSLSRDDIVLEAVWGLGEGIVSGKITPDRYLVSPDLEILEKHIGKKKIAITRDSSGAKEIVKLKDEISERQVLSDSEVKRISDIAIKLEDHYKKPQDVEFAVERGEIYIVQTRPITTLETRGGIGAGGDLKGEVILSGIAASPGIGSGKIRIVNSLEDLNDVKQGDVLVTKMTNPDMAVVMQRSSAIVTDEGGLTAHASIVSREMGIPAVVGTQEATSKLKDGEVITVNGFTGKIYKGKVAESVQKEVRPVTVETKTKLKVIVDLPSFAERASKSNISSVGLARIEGIIAESGKHPFYFLDKGEMEEYEALVFNGVKEIAKHFDDIWVRTSDLRSDEFTNLEGSAKEKEANPMLGMHGVRYGLKHPEILKSELRAMKKISESGKGIGILVPQVISVEEVKGIKSILNEVGFFNANLGVMVETPAAVQIISELCDEGIGFVSFGTNDLTQYTLAVDRGNEQVQELYNEMHPSVLRQIEFVIKRCKEKGVETSICGQAGSKKDMVKFLVEAGIDSISVNADVAADVAEYLVEIEKQVVTAPIESESFQERREFSRDESRVVPENLEVPDIPFIGDSEPDVPPIKGAEDNLVSLEESVETLENPRSESEISLGRENVESSEELVNTEIPPVEEDVKENIEEPPPREDLTSGEWESWEGDSDGAFDENVVAEENSKKEKEEDEILDIF